MGTVTHVPPGFRFHPTDEELVHYYLRKKIASKSIDLDIIKEVDLYSIEPSDLQEICKIGDEEQHDWYFFSHKDKKYPTGTRTNRASTTGFWKATGRDKPIYLKHKLIGMRKTLVFYKGRAPNGQKSDWIMHEYRLESDENETQQEEGWVVCRAFKKRALSLRKGSELIHHHHEPLCWYDDNMSLPSTESQWNTIDYHNFPFNYKEQIIQKFPRYESSHHLHLPELHNHKFHSNVTIMHDKQVNHDDRQFKIENAIKNDQYKGDQAIDWRILDKFVASQLSQDGLLKDQNDPNQLDNLHVRGNEDVYASKYSEPSITVLQIEAYEMKYKPLV